MADEGRYSPRKRIDVGALGPRKEKPGDDKNEQDSDFWRFVGDVAPVAGGVLGGIGGGIAGGIGGSALPGVGTALGAISGAGAGIAGGAALGQGVKGFADSQADEATEDREAEEISQNDRRTAVMQALLSMRR